MQPYYRIELNGWRGHGCFDPDDIKEYRQHGAIIHEFALPDCSPYNTTPAASLDASTNGADSAQEVSHGTFSNGAAAESVIALELDLPDTGDPQTV